MIAVAGGGGGGVGAVHCNYQLDSTAFDRVTFVGCTSGVREGKRCVMSRLQYYPLISDEMRNIMIDS